MLHSILRTANRCNPTTRGKHRVISLARRLHALPGDGVHTVNMGLRMHLRLDQFIDRTVYFYAYEPCLTRTLLKRLSRGATFVDVGANIGYYTLLAARTVGPQGRVFSFEPQPEVYRRLSSNIQLNELTNVRVFNCALADTKQTVTLCVPPQDVGFGHASLKEQGWESADRFEVEAHPLDDLLAGQTERVDVIKVDAEGAEAAILRGARNTLCDHRPDLFVELNAEAMATFGYKPIELIEYIVDCYDGYRFAQITGHRMRDASLEEFRRNPELCSGDLLAYVP